MLGISKMAHLVNSISRELVLVCSCLLIVKQGLRRWLSIFNWHGSNIVYTQEKQCNVHWKQKKNAAGKCWTRRNRKEYPQLCFSWAEWSSHFGSTDNPLVGLSNDLFWLLATALWATVEFNGHIWVRLGWRRYNHGVVVRAEKKWYKPPFWANFSHAQHVRFLFFL